MACDENEGNRFIMGTRAGKTARRVLTHTATPAITDMGIGAMRMGTAIPPMDIAIRGMPMLPMATALATTAVVGMEVTVPLTGPSCMAGAIE